MKPDNESSSVAKQKLQQSAVIYFSHKIKHCTLKKCVIASWWFQTDLHLRWRISHLWPSHHQTSSDPEVFFGGSFFLSVCVCLRIFSSQCRLKYMQRYPVLFINQRMWINSISWTSKRNTHTPVWSSPASRHRLNHQIKSEI